MNILQMLQSTEPAYLALLAEVWGVKLDPRADVNAMIDGLFKAMTDPVRAEAVWDKLDDKARGAVQLLIGTGAAMPEAKFVRVFGDIRRMGEGQLKREQPHRAPLTSAEALYYRGLIAQSFENGDAGPRTMVIIPRDLLAVLPVNKTGYSKLEPGDDEGLIDGGGEAEPIAALDPLPAEEVKNVKPADTSLVDDLTTLLAYLRLKTPLLDGESVAAGDYKALAPHLLTQGETRTRFMLAVGVAADLIEVTNGRAAPSRAGAPKWLGKTRHEQVRALADAWRVAAVWVDLWQVPGLRVDASAGAMPQYSPANARAALLEIMMHTLPGSAWWSMDQFIELVAEDSADFQRPNGDFDSWYIYDQGGALLAGIDNWWSVEGAMIDFIISGPMHWLGLVDLGQDAARLSAYGRAFFKMGTYPSGQEVPEPIEIGADGSIKVPRKAARADRYQVARFASWVSAGNVYGYKLDRPGIAQAEAQGITTGHIASFLKRIHGDKPLPEAIARLVEAKPGAAPAAPGTAPARGRGASETLAVTMERTLVLRTTAPETLDAIVNNPALRRFTGARLGEMAVVVLRSADLEAFAAALADHGISVDLTGL